MRQQKPTATAKIEQVGYPPHADDSGPWLPTTTGGLVCGKCHTIVREPYFGVLRLSRQAHREAGCEPINVERPKPSGPASLSVQERTLLRSVSVGNGMRITAAKVAPLVMLGLVREESDGRGGVRARTTTDEGARIAALCVDGPKPETILMFDLGEPDPRAFARTTRARR